jgi:hypothetical protein
MTNLVSNIKDQNLVKEYGITEVFFIDGEIYTTSDYMLNYETILNLEKELKEYK